MDIEGGYGETPAEVAKTVASIIAKGVVGINFEDQILGGTGLYSSQDQSARIRSIREIGNKYSIPIFINARTDLFFKEERDHAKLMNEAFDRLQMYYEVVLMVFLFLVF